MRSIMKFLSLILAFLMLLSVGAALVGCNGDTPDGEPTTPPEEDPNTPDATDEGTEAPTEETTADGTADETEPPTEETTTDVTDPPAEETTDEVEDPVPADYVYKHVVVIGVDGAGAFFQNTDTPNLDKIFADGAVTYKMLTSNPTISAQCWGSMLHGVTADMHGLTNAIVENTPYPTDSAFPGVFRVIREQMPDAKLGSLCNWNPINVGIVEDGIDVYKKGGMGDAAIINEAISYVKEEQPTFLFIQLDEADGAGHGSGYNTPTQHAKITEQDALIGKLYEVYEKLGILEDTLFIVTADHGGNGNSHGGWTDAEKYVMFAAAGKTVEKGGSITDMEVRDVPLVVLHALGLEAPTTWSARIPSGLFKGVTAGERPEYVNPDSDRYHEATPTPEKGSEGYITNFITDKTLKTYLTFDGDTKDALGSTTTKEGGKLYFVDGYFGKGVSLDDGYVAIPNYAPEKGSFTIALWVKTMGASGDPVLFSNKDWDKGYHKGYVLSLMSAERKIRFNAGDGTNRMDGDYPLPADYYEGWMHVTLVVDREKGTVSMAYDFGTLIPTAIPASLLEDSFTALNQLCIGTDGTGAYKFKLSATVDEFMIFDGALDKDDMAKLAAYYGKEPPEEGFRMRESSPTPEKGSEGYVTNFVTDKTLKTYLTFDGSATDAFGNAAVSEKGTVTYTDGFFGQAAVLDKGYISLADYHPDKSSFTMALWVKTQGVTSDPVLLGNKNWGAGVNKGFVLSLRDSNDLKFNVGDGANRADKEYLLPSDFRAGWVYVVLVVDREKGEVKLSYDFGAFQTMVLPASLRDDSFDAFEVLNIGQDGTGAYSASCKATVDEFMLFDGVLDEDDLAALAEYYGV